MLDEEEISSIVSQAASETLHHAVGAIEVTPYVGEFGNEALRVLIVLPNEFANSWEGEKALELLMNVRNGLVRRGEERFPSIGYVAQGDYGVDQP